MVWECVKVPALGVALVCATLANPDTRTKFVQLADSESLVFMPFRLLKKQGCFFNTFGAHLKP